MYILKINIQIKVFIYIQLTTQFLDISKTLAHKFRYWTDGKT